MYSDAFRMANQYAVPAIAGEIIDRFRGRKPRINSTSSGSTRRRVSRVASGREVHYLDYTVSDTMADNVPVSIATVPTGTSIVTRVGRKVRMLAIQYMLRVRGGHTQTTPMDFAVRFYRDNRPRGAVPAITDILTNATMLALPSMTYGDRFTLLREHTGVIASDGDTLTGAVPGAVVKGYIPLNFTTEWEAANTDGSYDDCIKNGLLVCLNSNGGAATTSPYIGGTIRVLFRDI